MNARDEQVRQVVAELDAHLAQIEADVAALKALVADDEAPRDENPS